MRTLKGPFGLKGSKLLLHSDQPEASLAALTQKTGADGFIRKTSDGGKLDQMIRSFL